jgi:uncharacterized protein
MKQLNYLLSLLIISHFGVTLSAAKKKAPSRIPPAQWIKTIDAIIPAKATVKAPKKQVLVFSLATGYKHYVIPYVDEVLKSMASKTGAFEVTITHDISYFKREKLDNFDAVILNNTCSDRKERHLFRDVLIHKADKFGSQFKELNTDQRTQLAKQLEQNLLDYVAEGKGLMVLHGAINMLNKLEPVSQMIGGSFAYHPPFQSITLELVEPDHALCKAFEHESISYKDEPYILNGAYQDLNFRPLLSMDTSKLVKVKPEVHELPRYMAWIKKHGQGRVFFSSPGHSHTTYENPKFLQFYLDGLQYVLGDLKCPDTVPKK